MNELLWSCQNVTEVLLFEPGRQFYGCSSQRKMFTKVSSSKCVQIYPSFSESHSHYMPVTSSWMSVGRLEALTVNSENSERSVTELHVMWLILANACCVSEYAFGADVILLTVIWPAFTAATLIPLLLPQTYQQLIFSVLGWPCKLLYFSCDLCHSVTWYYIPWALWIQQTCRLCVYFCE